MDGADFVTLPLWLLVNTDLNDGDIRVLLILDQMGYREGERDGVVRASNQAIGERIGKSTWFVARSLQHVLTLRLGVLRFEVLGRTRRGPIVLLYDRLGRNRPDPMPALAPDTDAAFVQGCTNDLEQFVQICTNPPEFVQGCTNEEAPFVHGRTNFVQPCTNPPIREREVVVAEDGRGEFVQPCTNGEASDITAAPASVPELIDWLVCIADDAGTLARLRKRVPLWVARIRKRCPGHAAAAIDWVQDALIKACDKDDAVEYAEKMLAAWVGAGGRPDFELAPRPKAAPDETDVVAPARPSPPRPASPPLRPTKAERNSEITAARRASVARHFAPLKEPHDGPR